MIAIDPAQERFEVIDQVARRVLARWFAGHTAEEHDELRHSRPSIPRDADRALLLDLSAALGEEDLSDTLRHELRARFWRALDER